MSDSRSLLAKIGLGVLGINTAAQVLILVFLSGFALIALSSLFPVIVIGVSLLMTNLFVQKLPKDKRMSYYLLGSVLGIGGVVFGVYSGLAKSLFTSNLLGGQSLFSPAINLSLDPIYLYAGGVLIFFGFLFKTSQGFTKLPNPIFLILITALAIGSLAYIVPRDKICPDGGLVCDDPVNAYKVTFPMGRVSNCLICGDGVKIVIEPSGYAPTSEAQEVLSQGTSSIKVVRRLVGSSGYSKVQTDEIGELGTLFDRSRDFGEWSLINVPAGSYTWTVEASGFLGEHDIKMGSMVLP